MKFSIKIFVNLGSVNMAHLAATLPSWVLITLDNEEEMGSVKIVLWWSQQWVMNLSTAIYTPQKNDAHLISSHSRVKNWHLFVIFFKILKFLKILNFRMMGYKMYKPFLGCTYSMHRERSMHSAWELMKLWIHSCKMCMRKASSRSSTSYPLSN